MVGLTKIGRGNAKYWIEAVAEGGEDYYTKPGEKPGQWLGDLAAKLGLEGEVDRDAYFDLLAGKDPRNGEALLNRPEPHVYVDASGKARRKEPILGYDIRFSAPKSVSLLWAIGSPEVQAAVEQAVDLAVKQALLHMEVEACFVRRGRGGGAIEHGAGFISMGFLHRSSRAGDPALHVHVVTANMTQAASDGRWLSLANPKRQSPLLREAKATGYVFQAVLRAELTQSLGVSWEPVKNGYADVQGVTRELIEHFSQRRAEIVAEMADRGTDSAAAAEVAAYRTRDAKDYEVDPDHQRADWRSRAAEYNFTDATVDRLAGRRRGREPVPLGAAATVSALATLEATHSHFDRRDVLCALVDQLGEGAAAVEIDAAVDGLLASSQVVKIHSGEGLLGTSYFTTPRLLALEERVLKTAAAGTSAGAAVVGEATLSQVLRRHSYLSDEQLAMVRGITTGGERIVAVAARPGTGKTTALRAAREAWGEAGVHGIGVATARTASAELADAGVPSMSVTALLVRCEEAISRGIEPLPPGTVIVLDEASTTPTPDFAALVDLVEGCGGKLVCIGDPRQIGAVGPGGVFGRLTTVTEPAVLNEIRRQSDPYDRRIVELAHEGRGSDALDLLRARDRLVIADTHPEAVDAQVLDWHRAFSAGEDAVMIARRIRDVEELNALARQLLQAEGRLSGPKVGVGGEEFAIGDRIITRLNRKEVSNRERWEVVGIDSSETHLKLRRLGGDRREVVLAPGYLGDRTDSGEPSIQHAYALTTYATQSKTFDSAFALLDSGVASEDFLVAVSRAKGKTMAYGVAASELLDADLGPATREIDDDAYDLRLGAERVAAEFTASEVSERKKIQATPEYELVEQRRQLIERAAGATSTADPEVAERRRALEERIADLERRASRHSRRRAELESGRRPDRHAVALEAGGERRARGQLSNLRAELSATNRDRVAEPKPGLAVADRVRLVQIEDQLVLLRRRTVRGERLEPSQLIVDALGPRPRERSKLEHWNEGVDLIVGYRQLNKVSVRLGDPLGPVPDDLDGRRHYREAQQRLDGVRLSLGRGAVRKLGKEIGTPH